MQERNRQGMPVALTIAGSDCSAGAGIQADLKTFQWYGVHGLTAVTCVVAETANVMRGVHPVPVGYVVEQVALLLDSFPVAALKTGMLYSREIVCAVAREIAGRGRIPLVVDPVMIASTGDALLEAGALRAYRDELLPLAALITPNIPEAEELLGERIVRTEDLAAAALRLAERYGTSVLLKGGHIHGPECVDVLAEGGEIWRFASPRLEVAGSHGTGCTLSAAVTAGLARGWALREAVARAKCYLNGTLGRSYGWVGKDGRWLHALDQGTTGGGEKIDQQGTRGSENAEE